MNCSLCEGALQETLTTFIYEQDERIIAIRNVPTYVCTQCGEKEYAQSVTHLIIALIQRAPPPESVVQVPVYDLALRQSA
jgi:YgiT-type zinc finger domain-containing protein